MYEYLLHVGAQKSAQTFLSEVRLIRPLTFELILNTKSICIKIKMRIKQIQIKLISMPSPFLTASGETLGIIMHLWVVVYKSV